MPHSALILGITFMLHNIIKLSANQLYLGTHNYESTSVGFNWLLSECKHFFQIIHFQNYGT